MDHSKEDLACQDSVEDVSKKRRKEEMHVVMKAEPDSHLFLSQSDREPKQKRSRPKKPKDMPKRPLSAYNIFFKEKRAKLQAGSVRKSKLSFEELGKTIGALWKDITPNEKKIYQEKAGIEMQRYQEKMLVYQKELAKRGGVASEEMPTGDDSISDASDAGKAASGTSHASHESLLQDRQVGDGVPNASSYLHSIPGPGNGNQQLYPIAMAGIQYPALSHQNSQLAQQSMSLIQQPYTIVTEHPRVENNYGPVTHIYGLPQSHGPAGMHEEHMMPFPQPYNSSEPREQTQMDPFSPYTFESSGHSYSYSYMHPPVHHANPHVAPTRNFMPDQPRRFGQQYSAHIRRSPTQYDVRPSPQPFASHNHDASPSMPTANEETDLNQDQAFLAETNRQLAQIVANGGRRTAASFFFGTLTAI